ncbi:MAG: TlpA family protein disulfide reductase [Rhodobacteraceae bacterium]|nr:TlpA family protein disulfide reductase [Paracoccaceae bacterium]
MLRFLVLYTALALGANAASAADLAALKLGDMKKLVLTEPPVPAPDVVFLDESGAERRLSDWQGKVVLVNFWATWCAPCRAEMPALDRLQAELGGDAFEVLTIATGRNTPTAIDKFFTEAGVTLLPRHKDERQQLARSLGVVGLPVTVIFDAEGQEVARLIGEAEWDAPEAKDLIRALTED